MNDRIPSNPRGFESSSVWWPLVREVVLLIAGVVLLVVESTHKDPRTALLLVGLALVGIPVAGIFDRAIGGQK